MRWRVNPARSFEFETMAGPYWSVIDSAYEKVAPADTYLQYVRFAQGLSNGTSQAYSRDLALYFTWCAERGRAWDDPDITALHLWLRRTPSPFERRETRLAFAGPGGKAVRSDAAVDRISMVVCQMFRHLVSQAALPSDLLNRLYETTVSRDGLLAIGPRRHRLKKGRRVSASAGATPVPVVHSMLAATNNLRDLFLVLLTVSAGLRRGEVAGLRLSDMHLLPTSFDLGCGYAGPHVHVIPRVNSNAAAVKGGVGRVVPMTMSVARAYALYRRERDAVPAARNSDFVFVNLYRDPLGEPMKIHAVNELFSRLTKKIGYPVHPHALRHTFGTAAVQATNIDVVAELMGHAWVSTTATYLHPSPERLRAAVEGSSIAGLLDPAEGS